MNTETYPEKGLINHSFERMVRFIFAHLDDPKVVVEFGTGYSTALFAELMPDGKIYSFENIKKWYDYHKDLFKDVNKIIILDPRAEAMYDREFERDMLNADVVFIDGCDRKEAYDYAMRVLKAKIVVVHDAQWCFSLEGSDAIIVWLLDAHVHGNWRYMLRDDIGFDKTQNIDTITLALSNVCDLNAWHRKDAKVGLANLYSEG